MTDTTHDDLVKRLRRASVQELPLKDYFKAAADRIEELEAKLAQAVGALQEAWFMLTVPLVNYEPEPEEPGLRRIKSTLAEMKGQGDESSA